MKLAEIFTIVIPELAQTEKNAVLTEMIDAAVENGKVPEAARNGVIREIFDREALAPTGLGRGVAVPHARCEKVSGTIGIIARSRVNAGNARAKKGIEYNSLDGDPVDLFFMLLSAVKESDVQIAALDKIARLVKNEHFVAFLRNAKTEKDIIEIFKDAEYDFNL